MNGGSRRQYILLGLLGVLVFAYFRYGGTTTSSGETVGNLPPIEIGAVIKRLQDVSTVTPGLVDAGGEASQPDRNLFQYGERRAPAPPPMTEEERRAKELALITQEQNLRAQKQAADEEAARQAALAAQQQAQQQQAPPQPDAVPPAPAQPVVPVKGPPPAINYKFIAVMGPTKKKVGVFVDGDKMVLAKAGEIVDGRFRVIDVGIAWSDWGYVDPDWKDQRKRLYYSQ